MPVKLFIGLPIHAGIDPYFLRCWMGLVQAKPCEMVSRIARGDGIGRSRNHLTADFLASDCTHLLFIDSDLMFEPAQVARIVSHDVPVVGGLYAKKEPGPAQWVVNTLTEPTVPDERGLQPVRYIGTGFLCIRRDVFTQMIARYPELEYQSDFGERRTEHDFWSMGVYQDKTGDRRYLSEDWYFCQRWLDMGGQVLADNLIRIPHLGSALFPLEKSNPA